ncbi:type II toxin-antitoxin system death-on-curing family toxin [Pleurocapsa sp. CCALA 161]|uniref:type II toxin-antitoxin system death-on-curing family toxin n=1 Tax=Pleurocapsa sp. CCALA 161 TaxID=2107688 RepID=UPI000D066E6B|nr:type II toxin-antitoxin system death-on-curing family toxin [Pleurocapsa sp. CCALA 161]PSB06665.1 type II toxin-antitoxin system death-on-curing family toxin [Pleurocapsa sp. CCALA 161]
MSEPIWIDADALRLLHGESLAEFGGLSGMRDKGLFLSALARPRNLFVYEEVTNISRLAAAYAYGLARNHTCGQALCFSDGNKRAAFLAIGMFLAINGFLLKVEPTEAVNTMLALAAGDLTELDLASWIEKFIVQA